MDVVVYLLLFLPAEFNGIKAAIENRPNENLNLDFITQKLKNAEALMQNTHSLKGITSDKNVSVTCNNAVFRAFKCDIICYLYKNNYHYAKDCNNRVVCHYC